MFYQRFPEGHFPLPLRFFIMLLLVLVYAAYHWWFENCHETLFLLIFPGLSNAVTRNDAPRRPLIFLIDSCLTNYVGAEYTSQTLTSIICTYAVPRV